MAVSCSDADRCRRRSGADAVRENGNPASYRAIHRPPGQSPFLTTAEAQDVPMKVQVGDVDHLKVFANELAPNRWFEENDPEGVAFEYEVLE